MRYSYLGKRTEANGSFENQGTDYKGTERIKGERNGLKVNGSGDLRFLKFSFMKIFHQEMIIFNRKRIFSFSNRN